MEYQLYFSIHLLAALAVVLVLAAWLRNPFVVLINRFMGLWASILAPCKHGLEADIAGLRRAFAALRREMAFTSEHTRPDLVGASGFWDVITPVALIPLLLVLLAADVVFSDLRFAGLLGTRPDLHDSGLPIGTLASALFVCLSVTFGLALFDILGATPSHRPWCNFSEANRRRLAWFAKAGLILSCLTAAIFWTWGVLQQFDEVPAVLDVGMQTIIWMLLGVLLLSATLLVGWIVVVGWGSFAVIAVGALFVIALARPVTNIWNWLMKFGWAKRLRLDPIVPVDPSPIEVTTIDSILSPEKSRGWDSLLHVRESTVAGRQAPNGRGAMVDVTDG